MQKQDVIDTIKKPGIIVIIRSDRMEGLVEAVGALYAAGITTVEISLTTPGTLEVVSSIRKKLTAGCVIGVGTAMDADMVHRSVTEGAQFIVSPIFCDSIVKACNDAHVPIVCGAYTPTEAWSAYVCGADFIKIFPANQLGPEYIKALLAPMPKLPLIPTGGVTVQNCAQYLRAGCTAVGVGTSVVNTQLITNKNWQDITLRAEEYVRTMQRARKG